VQVLRTDARIAGTSWELRNRLNEYGKCVGLAFQIADDLLDISGDPAVVGKGVRKDAAHGKLTYPSLLGVEESRRQAGELISRAREWLEPFGASGRSLEALADFIIERDH
jgi:geranylgeranyl diphosphate synthase type II